MIYISRTILVTLLDIISSVLRSDEIHFSCGKLLKVTVIVFDKKISKIEEQLYFFLTKCFLLPLFHTFEVKVFELLFLQQAKHLKVCLHFQPHCAIEDCQDQ